MRVNCLHFNIHQTLESLIDIKYLPATEFWHEAKNVECPKRIKLFSGNDLRNQRASQIRHYANSNQAIQQNNKLRKEKKR